MVRIQRLIKFTLLLMLAIYLGQQAIIDCHPVSAAEPMQEAAPAQKVLDPNKFIGKVSMGYKAAQTIPEICSHLFCYCGCDLTDSHTSLLDCFTCMHGVDCDICQDEAIVALHLKEEGKSLLEIQQTIEDGFASQYPWDKSSPTLIKYRQALKLAGGRIGTESGTTALLKKSNKTAHPGKCCGHDK